MSASIVAAPIAVPQENIEDLRDRLGRTRWPDAGTAAGWEQGVPLSSVQPLCAHWRDGYDWRRCEAMLNGWNPHRTVIDGLGIHFFHVASPEPDALPLVMTHGWPGSVAEFQRVVGPLTDPRAHGGDPADAVHLIMPSLPGYGFSDKPTEPGWDVGRVGDAWIELMRRLGYGARWAAQGGDWGGAVALAIGARAPAGCVGLHLNICFVRPDDEERAAADARERGIIARLDQYDEELSGYAREQATRPQTIGYALADSPVGQAAWIYEKFRDWTDGGDPPEVLLSRDAMLDTIAIYWLTNSGASSARLYAESMAALARPAPVKVPLAFSMFPREMSRASERWARRRYPSIVYWSEAPRGGHFAAFEQPGLFVDEVRAGLRALR